MDISLKCSCGKVSGTATEISAASGTRAVCYCSDCQAFANYLKRADEILNTSGGTDVFQTTPSQLQITEGRDQLRCMRLSPKGLHRWYTGCCNTPIGNTMTPGFPFVGVIHNFMDLTGDRDTVLGPVRAHIQTKSALSRLPDGIGHEGLPLGLVARTIRKLAVWKLRGLHQPSPFFDADGKPVSTPKIADTR